MDVQQTIEQIVEALFPRPREEQLLKVAYDAHIAGDMVKKKQALEVWLDKAFGVSVGSLVEVSGLAKPRQILLESVDVTWGLDEPIERGFTLLRGPTDDIGGCEVKLNDISVRERIWKAQSPTERMKRNFGDRLPR